MCGTLQQRFNLRNESSDCANDRTESLKKQSPNGKIDSLNPESMQVIVIIVLGFSSVMIK